jgi:hypothetical protein
MEWNPNLDSSVKPTYNSVITFNPRSPLRFVISRMNVPKSAVDKLGATVAEENVMNLFGEPINL